MKFLLVEDDAIFRGGFDQILKKSEPDLETLPADSCEAAFELLKHDHDVQLIVLDRQLNGMSGLEGLVVLRERYPDIPVVILSNYIDRDAVYEALNNQAAGYIPKGVSIERILAAIKIALHGGIYLPEELYTRGWLAPDDGNGTPPPAEGRPPTDFGLTVRESQVLAWIVKGQVSDRHIARKLNIAEGVVGTHMASIYRKLSVTKRVMAVIKAFELHMDLRGWAVETPAKHKSDSKNPSNGMDASEKRL